MSPDYLAALAALPDEIDALTARIFTSNDKLREQVAQTQLILAELGIAKQVAASPAPVVRIFAAPPAPPTSPVDDEARLEQLKYLEARKAERKALVDKMRGDAP